VPFNKWEVIALEIQFASRKWASEGFSLGGPLGIFSFSGGPKVVKIFFYQ